MTGAGDLNKNLPRIWESILQPVLPDILDAVLTVALVVPVPPLVLQDGLLAPKVDAVDAVSRQPFGLGGSDHPLQLLRDAGPLKVGGAGVVDDAWAGGLILWDRGPAQRPQDDLLAQGL